MSAELKFMLAVNFGGVVVEDEVVEVLLTPVNGLEVVAGSDAYADVVDDGESGRAIWIGQA